MNARLLVVIALCIVFHPVSAMQDVVIDTFPYEEDFESVVPPVLPDGWNTSTNRNEDGDFQTNTLGGRNWLTVWHPGVAQYVQSPVFDFTSYRPETLSFRERRTGTFQATIILSASTDGGSTFPIVIDSTTYGGNGTRDEEFTISLPSLLTNESAVLFRWEVIPHDVGSATSNARYEYIRIDAAVQYTHELQVTSVQFTPHLPTTADPLDAAITILNAGLEPASGFTAGVRSDAEEILDELFISGTIEPGDSITIHLSINPLFQSIHSLHAYVDYDLNEGTQTSLIAEVHVTEPVREYPWKEYFDLSENALPLQWRTSSFNNSPDASLTTSIVHDGNYAVVMSNATREQYLILPPFDPSNTILHEVTFFERRTATFDATVHVEISSDRGYQFEEIASFSHSGETGYVQRTIRLDETLSENDIIYIRLRLDGEGTGSTGTVRFDSFAMSSLLINDLALRNVTVSPQLPVPDDDIEAYVSIVNRGAAPVSGFTAGIRDDTILLSSEVVTIPVERGDSLTVRLPLPALDAGIHQLTAFLEYEHNEGSDTSTGIPIHVTAPVVAYPWSEYFDNDDPSLPLHWRTSITNGIPDATLTTSIVYAGAHSLIITDATKEQYLILPPFDTSQGILRELTFFERRTASFDATVYVDFSIDRGETFQEYNSFHHSGETIYIQRNTILDESLSDNDILYIRLRFAGDGSGTTGTIRLDAFNVMARMEHDIAVTGIEIDPSLPLPGDDIRVTVSIENPGLQNAHNFTARLYRLQNEIDEDPELLGSENYTNTLEPSRTVTIDFQVENIPAGYSLLRAEADYPPDIRPENNILHEEIFIRYPERSLIINEILYHTREGQPEFVEIYNPGDQGIDLFEWSIRDRETPGGSINRYVLSDSTLIIPPGSFAVLSANSSIFDWFGIEETEMHVITARRVALGLSSLGDEVMLLDPSGSVVDSVAYEPSWHHPDVFETRGRSLERISPHLPSQDQSNWSTSADPRGGTPGRHNSIFTETPVATANIEVHPNPFSPNMDGFEDYTIISYNLPQQTAMVRLRIFDSMGRPVRTLMNNQPSGPHGSVIWDGRNDKGRVARLGIYVILLEAYDSGRGGLTQIKSTVVLADRL